MPLSAPVSRELKHTRSIQCHGYKRSDGLWDIEGHLVDTKTNAIPMRDRESGAVAPGEPLHEMWLRITVDLDLLIHDAEAVTDWGPYNGCADITPQFKLLKGLTIKPGFTLKTRELLGGTKGCTHLVELLGPLATTAFQTIYGAREKAKPSGTDGRRPGLIDSCHMYKSTGRIVAERWPQWVKQSATEKEGS